MCCTDEWAATLELFLVCCRGDCPAACRGLQACCLELLGRAAAGAVSAAWTLSHSLVRPPVNTPVSPRWVPVRWVLHLADAGILVGLSAGLHQSQPPHGGKGAISDIGGPIDRAGEGNAYLERSLYRRWGLHDGEVQRWLWAPHLGRGPMPGRRGEREESSSTPEGGQVAASCRMVKTLYTELLNRISAIDDHNV